MAKTKIPKDIRDIIMGKMNGEGRSLTWLNKTTEIPYDTLYSCLKKKLFSLSQENLDKINTALKTDFTQPE